MCNVSIDWLIDWLRFSFGLFRLYEILPPSKPRVNSIMMKSTSLGALNASGQFGLSEPNSVEDEEPFPRQSTPVGKGTWPAGGGRGDGPGVSPINNGDPVDRTVTGKVPKAVNRTFEAEKKEEKATLSSETSPDENNAPGGQLNKTHDRLPQTEGTVKNAIPRVAPVKQTSIPPPGRFIFVERSNCRSIAWSIHWLIDWLMIFVQSVFQNFVIYRGFVFGFILKLMLIQQRYSVSLNWFKHPRKECLEIDNKTFVNRIYFGWI